MDSGRMDAPGGRARRRNKRVRKLVLAVLQNLLVVACLLLTLMANWRNPEEPSSEDIVHIKFNPIADIVSNGTLQFHDIRSKHRMNLTEGNRIDISCTGPYVLYMDACYISMSEPESRGYLQLLVKGQITACSFTLNATSEKVCRGLHSTVYLQAREWASLNLTVSGNFKVKKVSVALSYLLGGQCDY